MKNIVRARTHCTHAHTRTQVREYRKMLVKEHEDLYAAAIVDANKSMCVMVMVVMVMVVVVVVVVMLTT